jgi:hypothetical protein
VANPAYYDWSIPEPAYICLPQVVTANVPLVLNGLGLIIQKSGSVINFGKVSRAVSVTTNGNIGGNVTISGILNGKPVSQTIATPNNTTADTTQFFDTISSVVCTSNSTPSTISIGSGSTGRTNWFTFNPHCTYPALTIDVIVSGTINYTLQHTLFDPLGPNTLVNEGAINPRPDNVDAFTTYMDSSTVSDYASINFPIRCACIKINSSGADGALSAAFLQQGLT